MAHPPVVWSIELSEALLDAKPDAVFAFLPVGDLGVRSAIKKATRESCLISLSASCDTGVHPIRGTKMRRRHFPR